MPPGDPDWHLPPEDMPMIFEKKTPRDLCSQLKDPAQNGNRTPKKYLSTFGHLSFYGDGIREKVGLLYPSLTTYS
jgi:hypothetical protein